jgi:hypothetical protein
MDVFDLAQAAGRHEGRSGSARTQRSRFHRLAETDPISGGGWQDSRAMVIFMP